MSKTDCPSCGRDNDKQTAADGTDRPPTEGCLAICIYCANFAVFTGMGDEKRLPTEEEAAGFFHNHYLTGMRGVAMQVIAAREAENDR